MYLMRITVQEISSQSGASAPFFYGVNMKKVKIKTKLDEPTEPLYLKSVEVRAKKKLKKLAKDLNMSMSKYVSALINGQ